MEDEGEDDTEPCPGVRGKAERGAASIPIIRGDMSDVQGFAI